MAEFTCPECEHQQTVPDEYVGRRTKCPKCKASGRVQASSAKGIEPIASREEPQPKVVVMRQNGGTIQTRLARLPLMNNDSSLEREFITVIDNTLPAALASCTGVTTGYKPTYNPDPDYNHCQIFYSSVYSVKAIDDIRAIETRFLLFNVWGQQIRTLRAVEIADVSAGTVRNCQFKWNIELDNEAWELYASIAYIAMIRTAKGRVVKADIEQVISEAKQFSSKFSEADLQPMPRLR